MSDAYKRQVWEGVPAEYIKLTLASGDSVFMELTELPDCVQSETINLDEGEKMIIELVKMTPEEFEALPEFEGV